MNVIFGIPKSKTCAKILRLRTKDLMIHLIMPNFKVCIKSPIFNPEWIMAQCAERNALAPRYRGLHKLDEQTFKAELDF